MKKSLLIIGLFIGSMTATKAQTCTIANSCTPTNGYCSTPSAGTALPSGTEQVVYNTTIQMSLATSASGATINNATITATSGLPTGLTATPNPANGVINGGADGCILISGTPALGSAGTYTFTANTTINTSFGAFPATLTWPLTINTANGVATFANKGVLYLAPNPAGSQISIASDFYFKKMQIVDMIGNVVLSQEANPGTTTVDISKFNPGIYFMQITDGEKSATRKFIKE